MNSTRGHASRWAAFAGVGVMGFAVQLAAVALLTHVSSMPAAPATAIAVEITLLHNFVWHERWTWRDRAAGVPARVFRRIARFHVGTGVVSLVGNVAVAVTLVEWLHAPVLVANIVAVGVLGVINFLIADRYVFDTPAPMVARSHRNARSAGSPERSGSDPGQTPKPSARRGHSGRACS